MNHILLVDDDINFRRTLAIQLEFEGFDVTGCNTVKEALSVLQRSSVNLNFPDVVITDLRMPEIAGDEFIILLKEQYPSIPVIVMSAFEPPNSVSNYPYLKKPFKLTQMIETIYQVGEREAY
ncbi:hypothetical protein DRQ07_04865 [candidate division KSB1 bacterium]|nr:MAG: hypothetical protein DRQ07_04865 [candidate division KSB1 bacterium]